MKFTVCFKRPYPVYKLSGSSLSKPRLGICSCCRKFRPLVILDSYCANPLCDGIPF